MGSGELRRLGGDEKGKGGASTTGFEILRPGVLQGLDGVCGRCRCAIFAGCFLPSVVLFVGWPAVIGRVFLASSVCR